MSDDPDLPLWQYQHSRQPPERPKAKRSGRADTSQSRPGASTPKPELAPHESDSARDRFLGLRKRAWGLIIAAILSLVTLAGVVLREGIVKFAGGMVTDALKDFTTKKPSNIETGSITKEDARKRIEDECVAQRKKDVATSTERRKAAFADHRKCIDEWVKPWFSNQTAEQHCAPKRAVFLRFAQDVRDREAKDCTVAPAPK